VELDAIVDRLTRGTTRLLTVVGPAGVGKTRLAIAAGDELVDAFPDGVVFIDLTVVHDPALVLPAVAAQLGMLDTGIGPVADRLQSHLQDREMLIILDNFEQVLSAAGDLATLVTAAPGLRLLVTSRFPLRIRAEQALRLGPLPVPALDVVPPLAELMTIPSVALFVARAQAQRADFVPDQQQVPLLIQLIHQLDGLPLALELAAGQVGVMPLAAIARRLDRRLQALQWEAQDLPDRQRSLHATIDWSYVLLTVEEQRLFRHLGVFVGRVSLDALAAVVGHEETDDTLLGLIALAEKSLVLPALEASDDPEPAFRMLETVRQFAREQLALEGELLVAEHAHARYFVELAEQADPHLRERTQRAWYFRLEAEHDNLRLALRWLLDHDESEPALQLAGALGYFWWLRGYLGEGWRWLEETLRTAADVDAAVWARALGRAGTLLMFGGALEQSKGMLEAALKLAQNHALTAAKLQPLVHLGLQAAFAGELADSLQWLERARALAQQLQDEHQGDFTVAVLGYRSLRGGNLQDAAEQLAAAIAGFRARGNDATATVLQFFHAIALQRLGRLAEAVFTIQDGLRTTLALRSRWQLSQGLEATLALVGDRTDPEQRARLMGALDTLTHTTGAQYGTLAGVSGQETAIEQDQLERGQLEPAWRVGRSLPFAEAVVLALAVLDNFAATLDREPLARRTSAVESPLSSREQEILQLVAEGMTSRQIGQKLFLSPRTVDHHLTSIFNKLGVGSRAKAVALATQRGLLGDDYGGALRAGSMQRRP
jgi:predicted ATPase/DNA-binding CsgD family transcriptional regulator